MNEMGCLSNAMRVDIGEIMIIVVVYDVHDVYDVYDV